MAWIHDQDFESSLLTKEELVKYLQGKLDKVKEQVKNGDNPIYFNIMNITIIIDYDEEEISIDV